MKSGELLLVYKPQEARDADEMMSLFEDSGHGVFRATGALSGGALMSKVEERHRYFGVRNLKLQICHYALSLLTNSSVSIEQLPMGACHLQRTQLGTSMQSGTATLLRQSDNVLMLMPSEDVLIVPWELSTSTVCTRS